jgi:hypothetical protein
VAEEQRHGEEEERPRRRPRLRLRRGRSRAGGSFDPGSAIGGQIDIPGWFTVTGAGVAGLAVIAAIAGGLHLMHGHHRAPVANVGMVQVPSLVGMSLTAARTRLKQSGFSVRGIVNEVSTQPPATVLRTDPPGGTTANRGSGITIVLALGQPSATPIPGPNPVPNPGRTLNPPGDGGTSRPHRTAGRKSGTSHRSPVVVSVKIQAVEDSYAGSCPPPDDATTYRATISVPSGPATVTYRWTSSNGGDSDPATQTLRFPGAGPQSTTVTHHESFYLPDRTTHDWIAVDILTPQTGQSDHASYTLTCEAAGG